MGNTSSTTICTVYEREFITDFDHDATDMYVEIFVPTKNLIIRLLNDNGLVYVERSSEAQIKNVCINSLSKRIGRVENIQKISIDNEWIDACVKNYETTQIIKNKMPKF